MGVKAKFKELELRKQLLAASQLKIEEDILAVEKTCNFVVAETVD